MLMKKTMIKACHPYKFFVSVNCIVLMSSSFALSLVTPVKAGTRSSPIVGLNGQLTGGSLFVACEKVGNKKTTVTFQINAAPANPLISVGPIKFALTSVGFVFGLGSRQALYTHPSRPVATVTYRESLTWDGIYDKVEIGGSAFGVARTGTVKYFLGTNAYDSNRFEVSCG
jgi:hypothetical protein